MTQVAVTSSTTDQDGLIEPAHAVEHYLSAYVDHRPLPANLREAVRYALLGSGKRLRPILTIRACEALGGSQAAAMAPAGAIELIHCFSLVHDDLPAMDDDDLRRGRPTLHRHTNEAMAVLAGDLMMGLAFELIATRVQPASLMHRVSIELTQATNDMIMGQVYDTMPEFEPTVQPIERLRTTHRHKTGALISCACRMGALCAGADTVQLDAITRYAQAIGLMFQVVDDLLDVTQSTEHLGKAANKDAQKGKLTYPGLLGVEPTRLEVKRLRREALQALEPLGEGATSLRELCDYMAVRKK